MSKALNKYISVFIPTLNGEKTLAECIEAILGQELPEGYELEIIVTDSGSSDRTLEVLRSYSDQIKLNTIPNSEFSHGVTRQQAAEMAKGEYILFLSQDATPAHYRWLINMIEPFFVSDKVGCVFGRQTPRVNAAATIKREVSSVFGTLGAPDSIIIHRPYSLVDQQPTNQLNSFFSDANSAVRRSLLIGKVPFRSVNYAEDQALAIDMQEQGYLKCYAPQGEVWHSNEYTAREYFKRKFDEYIGLQESTSTKLVASRRELITGWVKPTWLDYKFIKADTGYTAKQKIKWWVLSPFYNIGLCRAKYLAIKHFTNRKKRDSFSLEKQLRK